jgi:hypothetical protein
MLRSSFGRFLSFVAISILALAGCTPDPDFVPFGERTIQVGPVKYELEIAIDYDKERVGGSAQLTVENLSPTPCDHVPLVLYRLMRVDAVRTADGSPLEFRQGLEEYEDWPEMQVRYAEVELPRPLPPGEQTTLAVDWSGGLHGYSEAMGYVRDRIDREFTILRRETKAYPRVDIPNDRVSRAAGLPEYDYEIRLTVPDDLVVANGGELLGVEHSAGTATWSYRNIKPAWRIDLAVAAYEILEAGSLKVFFFPGDEEGASRIVREFGRAVETFTEWFGQVPELRNFSVIEIPEGYGSQTDVTCILQTADAFRSEQSAHEFYHEASHLWNVTPTDNPSPRWNEGLASFLERLLIDVYAGEPDLPEVQRVAAVYLERLASWIAESPDLAGTPMIDYGKAGMTRYSYSAGMLMFGTLYRLVGPEDFNRIVGDFFQDHQATGGSTDQFVAYADAAVEIDLQPFFEDWLYTTQWQRFLGSNFTLEGIAETYR